MIKKAFVLLLTLGIIMCTTACGVTERTSRSVTELGAPSGDYISGMSGSSVSNPVSGGSVISDEWLTFSDITKGLDSKMVTYEFNSTTTNGNPVEKDAVFKQIKSWYFKESDDFIIDMSNVIDDIEITAYGAGNEELFKFNSYVYQVSEEDIRLLSNVIIGDDIYWYVYEDYETSASSDIREMPTREPEPTDEGVSNEDAFNNGGIDSSDYISKLSVSGSDIADFPFIIFGKKLKFPMKAKTMLKAHDWSVYSWDWTKLDDSYLITVICRSNTCDQFVTQYRFLTDTKPTNIEGNSGNKESIDELNNMLDKNPEIVDFYVNGMDGVPLKENPVKVNFGKLNISLKDSEIKGVLDYYGIEHSDFSTPKDWTEYTWFKLKNNKSKIRRGENITVTLHHSSEYDLFGIGVCFDDDRYTDSLPQYK